MDAHWYAYLYEQKLERQGVIRDILNKVHPFDAWKADIRALWLEYDDLALWCEDYLTYLWSERRRRFA